MRADPPRFQPDGTRESLAVPVEADFDEGNGRFTVNWLRSRIWNLTALIGAACAASRVSSTTARM